MIRARRGSILIDALVGFAVIAAAVLGFHALGRQSLTAKEAAEIREAVAEIALAEQAELAVRGAPLGRTERVIDRPPLPRLRLIREIVPGTPTPLRLVTLTFRWTGLRGPAERVLRFKVFPASETTR